MDIKNINKEKNDITDIEIKHFLESPENVIKYNLRFFEALFIKYLRDHDFITVEGMDILLTREKIPRSQKKEILSNYKESGLPTFEEEIRKRNPSLTVISHILIPELTLNNINNFLSIDLKKLVRNTKYYDKIAENIRHVGAFDKQIYNASLNQAIEDYDIAGFIKHIDNSVPIIDMTEYQAVNEIKRYRKIYGNYTVDNIDYFIKNNLINKNGN